MKILLATSSVTANSGVPSFNRELCSLLSSENEIHLLVDEDIKTFSKYKKVYSIFGKNKFDYSFCFALLSKINAEKYDVIINSKSYVMSILAPFLNNTTKLITVSHSLGTLDCDNAVFNHPYIDSIIALSQSCKDYILKRFSVKECDKIKIVYNSVVNYPDACSKRELKQKNEILKIVFAGGSAPSKSPELVVLILHELCKTDLPFEFYWLGNYTPPLKRIQPYQNVNIVLPDDERIIITGRIDHNKAADIIASCNVFLAPSKREGFPMALLEAMRVGCIPIVSDYNVANKEIICDGENGFVIPHNNVHEFNNRLVDILQNHSKYYHIYENSYKTFLNELSFPIWQRQIFSLIMDSALNHTSRKKITRYEFRLVTIRFWLLAKYNVLEMYMKEILPCALKFFWYYVKYGRS